MQNTVFSTNKTLNVNGRLLVLDRPRVMGILNVTPDSFYDGGRYLSETAIISQAEKMIREDADIIDVGGYSTRPGAAAVAPQEEKERVIKAISIILREFPHAIISVDTFRSEVAHAAVQEGAGIINDISGGELDPELLETVARLRVPYVLMHMRGNPQTMTGLTQYTHLLRDVLDYFHKKLHYLRNLGVSDVLVDPGFGFAKTRDQNFQLLNSLESFQILGHPVMVGVSRKSMVWKTLGIAPENALNGTTALHAIALLKGASMLRVHDIREAKEVVKLISQMTAT